MAADPVVKLAELTLELKPDPAAARLGNDRSTQREDRPAETVRAQNGGIYSGSEENTRWKPDCCLALGTTVTVAGVAAAPDLLLPPVEALEDTLGLAAELDAVAFCFERASDGSFLTAAAPAAQSRTPPNTASSDVGVVVEPPTAAVVELEDAARPASDPVFAISLPVTAAALAAAVPA